MKIGVALSGCDIGGVCAASILHWLRQEGLQIEMISASGMASPAALLFCCGLSPYRCEAYLTDFLEDRLQSDLDSAIAGLASHLTPAQTEKASGLSISAVDLAAGKAVSFSNDFLFETETLSTFPLAGAYEALSASIGTVDGLRSFPFDGYKLCDYCVQYGCPFFPLHLAGCERILSFSFVPQMPACPYEALINRRIEETCQDASLHLSLGFPLSPNAPLSFQDLQDFAINSIENFKSEILQSALF